MVNEWAFYLIIFFGVFISLICFVCTLVYVINTKRRSKAIIERLRDVTTKKEFFDTNIKQKNIKSISSFKSKTNDR
ncbi:MAG: hypothetical protein NC417_07325 [Candidatus Gastranaerophilales bacterium]|nr:hypothetical protein [Candidatus Gastranaerophilales bacterium]